MLIVTTTFTRPSADVSFYDVGETWKTYFKTTYIDTGKCTEPAENAKSFSPDNLILTKIMNWASQAYNDEYMADPVADAMKEARLAYSIAHNITLTFTRKLIHDAHDPA